jgi:hypothetical protein
MNDLLEKERMWVVRTRWRLDGRQELCVARMELVVVHPHFP